MRPGRADMTSTRVDKKTASWMLWVINNEANFSDKYVEKDVYKLIINGGKKISPIVQKYRELFSNLFRIRLSLL